MNAIGRHMHTAGETVRPGRSFTAMHHKVLGELSLHGSITVAPRLQVQLHTNCFSAVNCCTTILVTRCPQVYCFTLHVHGSLTSFFCSPSGLPSYSSCLRTVTSRATEQWVKKPSSERSRRVSTTQVEQADLFMQFVVTVP